MIKRFEMTERLKSTINIPVWVMTLIFSSFIALLSFTISVSVKAGTMQEKINNNEILVKEKANQSDVDRIYDELKAINQKIDKIIMK